MGRAARTHIIDTKPRLFVIILTYSFAVQNKLDNHYKAHSNV